MKKTCIRIFKSALSLMVAAGLIFSDGLIVNAATADGLPGKYDLRDDGLVTPVKFQNPWGTCWAFGAIAAIESSLLSYMGETSESYKAKSNGQDFDLSEKHLAWFAMQPVTEDVCESQVGEGMYPVNPTGDQSDYYAGGGEPILVGTLLASGIGPLFEETFPYRGKEGFTTKDYYIDHPEDMVKVYENSLGCTFEEYYKKLIEAGKLGKQIEVLKSDRMISDDVTEENFTESDLKEALLSDMLRRVREGNSYSEFDDWTIDEKNKNGTPNRNMNAGFVLSDGNLLPEFSVKDENGKWAGVNEEGMRAVKQELLEGRAIYVGFCADTSLPGQSDDATFLNEDTWAHYTFKDCEANHAVCIVGWDDDYSKDNFISGHRPPGDGAWIVKNSWGSETEYKVTDKGEKIGCRPWGVTDEKGRHTGYFYISYYDKSLVRPETINFSANIAANGESMYVLAYDYMPSAGLSATVQDDKIIRTANVFKNDSGEDLELVSFSTKTGGQNAQVVYDIYKLRDGAESPEDGEYLGRRRAFYPYAGFHREDMMKGKTIKDGETISIIATETVVNDDGNRVYEYVINNSYNEAGARAKEDNWYAVGIVNKGESYLFRDNKWIDWSDVMTDEVASELGDSAAGRLAIDNFSIKAYMVRSGSHVNKGGLQ